MRDTAYRAMQIKEQLTNKNNREPTIEEIAKIMEMPKEQVVLSLEAIVDPVSLYEPVFRTETILYMLWIKSATKTMIPLGLKKLR